MKEEEVYLNIFPIEINPITILAYELSSIAPETTNKEVKFKLAANIAKKISKEGSPTFSVGGKIFSTVKLLPEYEVRLDISGTNVDFKVGISPPLEEAIINLPQESPERFVNRLVDWYYRETLPKTFQMGGTNYIGENLFARREAKHYKTARLNVNEGLSRATRFYNSKPYLLLDIDYRVTWEKTLWEAAKEYVTKTLNRSIYLPDHEIILALNERFGRGVKKRGNRVQGKNQVGEYEVVEFDFKKDPRTPGTAGDTSQEGYFSKVYGTLDPIKDLKQPLVKVRVLTGYHRNKENYHVPELLVFERIPQYIKDDRKVMSALYNITKPTPRGRYSKIVEFVEGEPFGGSPGFAHHDFIKKFMSVSPAPLLVKAKVMPEVEVKISDKVFKIKSDSNFLGTIFKQHFHRAPQIEKLGLIYHKDREEQIKRFYEGLFEESKACGMSLPTKPEIIEVENGNLESFVEKLASIEKLDLDVLFSFTPQEESELYEAIKKESLVRFGLLSQNISYEKTLDRLEEYEIERNETGIKTILTMIAMQLCAKMGGAPWVFNKPILEEKCPILGLDVYYSEDGRSLSGACAVFDDYGEYLFSGAVIPRGAEDIDNLSRLLRETLTRYINKFKKPQKILIFRTGLNFTQEQKYIHGNGNNEVEVINSVLSEFEIPEFIYVMEKKNTMLRMYKKISSAQVENPTQGTVAIGEPFNNNEMLMTTQEATQGTVAPVMYKVIRPNNPDMEKIANAVYKLSRHHWNTYKAVKVPAPAMHADKINYLVNNILKEIPTKQELLDRPYYL